MRGFAAGCSKGSGRRMLCNAHGLSIERSLAIRKLHFRLVVAPAAEHHQFPAKLAYRKSS